MLNTIWEGDFLGLSYGFRPGRGQHDALDALAVGIGQRKVNGILDADIAGFFDAVSHDWLIRFIEHRMGDRRVIRLIRKWLKAGLAEDGQVTPSEVGTPQGAVINPPTILPKAVLAWAGRIGCGECAVDAEHDIDVVLVDLDPLDQGADQVALHKPVDLGHPVVDAFGEILEPSDDE